MGPTAPMPPTRGLTAPAQRAHFHDGGRRRDLLLHDIAGAQIDAHRTALAVEVEGGVVDHDRHVVHGRGPARRERLAMQEPLEEAAVAAGLRHQLLAGGLPARGRTDIGRAVGRDAAAAMGERKTRRRQDRNIRRVQHIRGDEHAAGLLCRGRQTKERQQDDGPEPDRMPHDGSPEAGCGRSRGRARRLPSMKAHG